MSDKSPSPRATRRAEMLKRRRRRQFITIAVCAGGAIALAAVALWLLNRPLADRQTPAEPAMVSVAPQPTEIPAAATPKPTPEPTEAPTTEPTPTPEPEPTPTVVPGSRPDVISFYHPKDKNYSPRVRFGDNYTGPWKKGKDIGSFEAIPSDAEVLDGDFFGDIFGAAWTAFPDADSCKIGYTLRYTLDDGSEASQVLFPLKARFDEEGESDHLHQADRRQADQTRNRHLAHRVHLRLAGRLRRRAELHWGDVLHDPHTERGIK